MARTFNMVESDNISDQRSMWNKRSNVNVRKTQSVIARDTRLRTRKLKRICRELLSPDASGGDKGAGWERADGSETDFRMKRSEFGKV